MHLLLLITLIATSVLGTELGIEVINPIGCTRKTQAGDTISVNYRGTLPNGEEFDSSYGRKPIQFRLGKGEVIQGYFFTLSVSCRFSALVLAPAGLACSYKEP